MASPKSDVEYLNLLKTVRDEILLGGLSSYTVANRTFTVLDLPQIEDTISYYELKIARATNGIKVGVAIGRNCK